MAISARDRITRLTVYGNESDMIDDINGTDYTDGVVDGTQRFEHIKFNSLPGFGEANAAMYKCEISGTTDLTGKWIRVRYCFYDTDSATTRTVEAVFAGKVDSCKYDRYHTSRSLIAYDKIYELRNIDISDWWSNYWSTANDSTAFAVFDAMCTYFGVSHGLSSSDFRNNITILKDAQKGRKLGGCSFADFLRFVGQINGFYWEVLPSGMLTCTPPTASYPQSFDTYTDFKETTIEDADAEAYGTFTVYDGADVIYTSGTGEPTYTFSNNILLYGHTTSSLVSILDVTKNYLAWFVGTRPATVEVIYSQIPSRQAISVTDNGTARTCVISKNEMWGAQLINQRLTCTGNRVIGTQYSSALNRAANEIQKIGTELTYKVNADNVIEAVNLEAQGGVQINAEALNINGVVTANGAFSIDLDGNPTIDATQASSYYAYAKLKAKDADFTAYYSSRGSHVVQNNWNFSTPLIEEARYALTEMDIEQTTPSEEPTASGREGIRVHADESELCQEKWYFVAPPSDVIARKITEGVYVRGSSDNPNLFPAVAFYEDTQDRVDGGLVSNRVNFSRYGKTGFVTTDEYGNQKASLNNLGVFSAYEVNADYGTIGSLTSTDYFATDNLGHNSHLTPDGLTVDSKDILRTHQSLVGGWGTEITQGKNLNTTEFLSVRRFFCPYDVTVATLTNCPTGNAFMMEVFAPISATIDDESASSGSRYRVRKILTWTGNEYIQICYFGSSGWTYNAWYKILTSSTDEGNSAFWLKAQVGRQSSIDNLTRTYANNRVHMRLDAVSSSLSSNPFDGDGYVITFFWDTAEMWDTQIFFPNGGGTPSIRKRRNNTSWETAAKFVLDNEYKTDTSASYAMTANTWVDTASFAVPSTGLYAIEAAQYYSNAYPLGVAIYVQSGSSPWILAREIASNDTDGNIGFSSSTSRRFCSCVSYLGAGTVVKVRCKANGSGNNTVLLRAKKLQW